MLLNLGTTLLALKSPQIIREQLRGVRGKWVDGKRKIKPSPQINTTNNNNKFIY